MKKIVAPALLLFFVLVAMIFVPYTPAHNLTDNLEKEINSLKAALPLGFGGRVITETACTCNVPPGLRLEVGPPFPMDVLYQPGISVLFSFYSLLPSEYILGAYIPGGVCLVGAPPACAGTPTLGTIIIAGTSLMPI